MLLHVTDFTTISDLLIIFYLIHVLSEPVSGSDTRHDTWSLLIATCTLEQLNEIFVWLTWAKWCAQTKLMPLTDLRKELLNHSNLFHNLRAKEHLWKKTSKIKKKLHSHDVFLCFPKTCRYIYIYFLIQILKYTSFTYQALVLKITEFDIVTVK